MKARVLRSAHSGLNAGMIGIVTGAFEGGHVVLFADVSHYNGFTHSRGPASIWCAPDDIELLPDDTCDAAFLLSFALLFAAPPVNFLHITTP